MAAARHWAIGSNDPERHAALLDAQALLKSMQDWKAGPEHTAPVKQEIERLSAETECNVHADNWEAVTVFLGVSTQWQFAGGLAGGVRTGLAYPGVESALRLAGVRGKRAAALFADLQLMELAALAAWREQREAGSAATQVAKVTQ